jgi:hypothetical protein
MTSIVCSFIAVVRPSIHSAHVEEAALHLLLFNFAIEYATRTVGGNRIIGIEWNTVWFTG